MAKCKHDWYNMSISGYVQKCSKCGMIKMYKKGTHDRCQRWEYKQGVPP